MKVRQQIVLAAIAGLSLSNTALAQSTQIGPSTKTESYVVPSVSGVIVKSILTTGDSVNGYRMAGVPDGLGPYYTSPLTKGATFDLVMHHEFGRPAGAVHSHGSIGSFVSHWTIDRTTHQVLSGRDQIASASSLFTWTGSGYAAGTTSFERFCSADLAGTGAFRNGTVGTAARIFLGGEETTPSFTPDHGRAWAHVVTGSDMNKTYELPRFGKMSFENAVANPFAQSKTVVMLSDDASATPNISTNICSSQGQTGCNAPPSEVYMYVGAKQSTGTDIDRAGLTNGKLYGLRVKVNGNVVSEENLDFVFGPSAPAVTSAKFEFVDFGDVSGWTGGKLQEESVKAQVTRFIRVEDGAWDPRSGKENNYYFVTTGAISAGQSSWKPSRLWHLHFTDITNPTAGGDIEVVLGNEFYSGAGTTPDADPKHQMLDNMTIDKLGRIVLTEDVGGDARLGRIYVYGIDSKKLVQVANANPKFFKQGGADFITRDEEASGIIDAADFLGSGWFLATLQAHKPSTDTELVESGQLMALFIDPSIGQ